MIKRTTYISALGLTAVIAAGAARSYKRLLITAFLLVMPLGIIGCTVSQESEFENDLNRNRQLWAEQNIEHYRYQVSATAQIPFPDLIIEVNDGSPVTTTLVSATDIDWPPELLNRVNSVPRLFQLVRDERDADEISVTYDPVFGYPTEIDIDPDLHVVDEEFTYTINGFEILQ